LNSNVVQISSGLVQLGSGIGMLSLASFKLVPSWFRLDQVFVRACSELGRLHLGLVKLASGPVQFALVCSSSLQLCRLGLAMGSVLAKFVLVLQRFGSSRLELDSA